MPAGAGTPRYEKPELWLGTANWHGGFCHATPRPQRGTSPRATFPSPTPSGFQPRIRVRGMLLIAGMTSWVAGVYPGSWSGTCSRTNGELRGRLSYPG